MQATESRNKQFFNKMRPWSNKYNQNWIGYIPRISHSIQLKVNSLCWLFCIKVQEKNVTTTGGESM